MSAVSFGHSGCWIQVRWMHFLQLIQSSYAYPWPPFWRLFQWLFVSHTEFLCKHHIKLVILIGIGIHILEKGDNSIIRLTSYFWFWGSASRFRSTFIHDILLGRKPWYYGTYWISPWTIWSQSCDINLLKSCM